MSLQGLLDAVCSSGGASRSGAKRKFRDDSVPNLARVRIYLAIDLLMSELELSELLG